MQNIGRELVTVVFHWITDCSGQEKKERARGYLHLAFICELYKTQLHGVGSSSFQTVTDKSLFGPNVHHRMNKLTRWLTNWMRCTSMARSSAVRQTMIAGTSDPLQQDPKKETFWPRPQKNVGSRSQKRKMLGQRHLAVLRRGSTRSHRCATPFDLCMVPCICETI